MKKIQLLLAGLVLMLLLPAANAGLGASWKNIYAYYATYGFNGQLAFSIDIATMEGVYHGEFYRSDRYARLGNMPNQAWSGPGNMPAPTVNLDAFTDVGHENCPGIDSKSFYGDTDPKKWTCTRASLTLTVNGDVGGCPWIVSTKANSVSTISREDYHYYGPAGVISDCPAIPLEPYDVSWNENTVLHNKVVRLQSTGGIIEQTLPTFLMKDGKLCDGSQLDERGAYCRFISQQMTFSASGCDNANVTVTPQSHPITDKQLHDMLLRVDTTARQPINSTCRFTYILNMY
jgi:hypothetical protein